MPLDRVAVGHQTGRMPITRALTRWLSGLMGRGRLSLHDFRIGLRWRHREA